MKRWSIGFPGLCVLLLTAPQFAPALRSGAGLSVAQAAPSHGAKKKGAKKKEEKVPVSAEISNSMGDLKWGAGKDELQKQLIDKVKEKYRPLVAKNKDAVEDDRLRNAANEEMKRIKDSFIQFNGTSTGWDVSFLRGEFTHGNDESMLVVRDQNSQNFYFFIDGRLWKWYKAFDAEVFRAGDFNGFAGAVQKRFGPAKDAEGELSPGSGKRHWLEWQDDKTRLRAVDQSDFYGFYCLVFEEKNTVAKLASLRTNTREVNTKQHALVDAVTAPPTRDADSAPDVVDRITGKSRASREAAAPSSSSSGKGSKKGAAAAEASSSSSAPAPSGVKSDDDPLRGLGL